MLEYLKLIKDQIAAKKQNNENELSGIQSRVSNYVFQDPERALEETKIQLKVPLSNEDEIALIQCLNSLMDSRWSNQFPFDNFFTHLFAEPTPFTDRWLQQLPQQTKVSYLYSLLSDPVKARTFTEKVKFDQATLDNFYFSLIDNQPHNLTIFEQEPRLISNVAVKTKETIAALIKGELNVEILQAIPSDQINENALFELSCTYQNLDIVTHLLKNGNLSANAKQNGLLRLLLNNQRKIPLQLMQDHGVAMNLPFPQFVGGPMGGNLTPLLMAMKMGNQDLIDEILNLTGDININHVVTEHDDITMHITPPGRSTLSFQIEQYDDNALTKRLIDKGADVNLPANQPLEFAFNSQNQELITLLLSNGARLSQTALERHFLEAMRSERSTDLHKIKQLLAIGGIKLLTMKPFPHLFSKRNLLARLHKEITNPQDEAQFINLLQAVLHFPDRIFITFLSDFNEVLRDPQSEQFKKIINLFPQDKLSLLFRTFMSNHDNSFLSDFLAVIEPQNSALMDTLYLDCLEEPYAKIEKLNTLFVNPQRRISESAYQSGLVASNLRAPDITLEQCQETVATALAKGADVKVVFEQACLLGKDAVIKTLLSDPRYELTTNTKGPKLAVQGSLHSHNVSTVALLLENHFSFNYNAMSLAFDARLIFPLLLNTLLDSDGNLDVNPTAEPSLLQTAIEEHVDDIAIKLIKHVANVTSLDVALKRTLELNKFDLAELLIKRGATIPPDILERHFNFAVTSNDAQYLKILLRLGKPKNIEAFAVPIVYKWLINGLIMLCQAKEDHTLFLDFYQLIQNKIYLSKANGWLELNMQLISNLLNATEMNQEFFKKFISLLPKDVLVTILSTRLSEYPSSFVKMLEMGNITDQKLLDEIYLKALTNSSMGTTLPPYETLDSLFINPVRRVSNSTVQTGRALRAIQSAQLTVPRLDAFLAQGADPNNIVVEACCRGNLEITKQLLKAPINEVAKEEAFHSALKNTAFNVAHFTPVQLEEAGFDFNHVFRSPIPQFNMSNLSALQLVMLYGAKPEDIMELLNTTSCDLNINHVSSSIHPSMAVESALSFICNSAADVKFIEKLLELGAKPDVPNGQPLKYAIEQGNVEIAKLLYSKGARLPKAYLKEKMQLHMSHASSANQLNALLEGGGADLLTDPEIINRAIADPFVHVLPHFINKPEFKEHLPTIFSRAVSLNRSDVVALLLKEGHQLSASELNQLLNNSIESKKYHMAQVLYDAGARIDSNTLRPYLLQALDSSRFGNFDLNTDGKGLQFMLSIWPEQPFNDREIIDEVINNNAILGLHLLVDANTNIDQQKYIFKKACEKRYFDFAKQLIDKIFVTPSGLEEAMSTAIEATDIRNDTAIPDYLLRKGTKVPQDQVATLLSKQLKENVNRKATLTKYLKYCPTPLTDINVVDKLFAYQDIELISILIAQGVSDELKSRIFDFTLNQTVQNNAEPITPVPQAQGPGVVEEAFVDDLIAAAILPAPEPGDDDDIMALLNQVQLAQPAAPQQAAAIVPAPGHADYDVLELLASTEVHPKKAVLPFYFFAANLALEAGYVPTADEAQKMASKASVEMLNAVQNHQSDYVEILQKLGGTLSIQELKPILILAIETNGVTTFNNAISLNASLNDADIINAVLKNPQPLFVNAILEANLNSTQLKTLFLYAHKIKNSDLISKIIQKGFEPTPLDWHHALLSAIENADKDTVLHLLTKGVSPQFNKSEALCKAVTCDRPNSDIVHALLDCGANPKVSGCCLPVQTLARYSESYNPIYLDIAQMLLLKMVPRQDLSDAFNRERQGTIRYAELEQLVFDTIRYSLKPHEQIAFELLVVREQLRKRAAEYAGDESLSRKSNTHFSEVVEPALKEKFNRIAGHSLMDKVVNIEKEIKAFLLKEILATCKQNPSSKNSALVAYIEKNQAAIIEGTNQAILLGMRQLATSNEDSAQIAWRAYDKDAPYNQSWDNLLTPQTDNKTVHTTAAASEGALSLQKASELSRYRVALYFLAINDLNKENFIQQIADMRRANATDERDCPSCYPGTLGRIGKLGAGHPQFQLPPDRREIIQQQISALVLKNFSDQIANMELDEASALYQSLVMLATENAEELIAGNVYYDEDWLALRNTFIGSLGTTRFIGEKINTALMAAKEPVLTQRDAVDVGKEVLDIAGSGRAMQLGIRLNTFKEKISPKKPDEEKPMESIMVNPFVLTPSSIPGMLPAERKKTLMENRIKRFIEFEILVALCKQQFPPLSAELQVQFIKEIVDNIFSSDASKPDDVLRESCASALTKFKAELNLDQNQCEALTQRILTESSLMGLSDEKAEQLNNHVLSKQLTKDNPIFNELLKGSCARVFSDITSKKTMSANAATKGF